MKIKEIKDQIKLKNQAKERIMKIKMTLISEIAKENDSKKNKRIKELLVEYNNAIFIYESIQVKEKNE
ncbi:hypothetical protein [Aliivibrio sp. EL58]|uniref:hypothetical protein n=1 Tax=Aliivibrio sp. EL58 TaxID=2107582 RepID=UPI000EFB9B11|nr:hypothetical protein [Aliivibrio sp. EL58]